MKTAVLALLVAGLSVPIEARGQSMPSTEQFMNMLGTCAASMNLKISADTLGSIKTLYEGSQNSKFQGQASIQNMPEFLKLFPDNERKDAYAIYVGCVVKFAQ
jgi:hypothetical protein